MLLALILGFNIGALLGLLGGGGSILTVPALVYLIGQSPQVAVTTSLAIVGANSAIGVLFHRAHGSLNWRVALLFGGTGMIVSFFAAGLSKLFPESLHMVAFSALMLVIGGLMISQRGKAARRDAPTHIDLPKTIAAGAGVGLVTGLLGVGGGFLIVPALVMLVGLPMHQAIGTSLVVIAMNSFSGFLGHLDGTAIDYGLIFAFVAAGLGGTYLGAQWGQRIAPDRLRTLFAVFVIVLALFLLYDNVPALI